LKSFSVFGLEGFPLVKRGDDLARIIVETCAKNGLELQDSDIIVVAQKVFSKAEGRVVRLKGVVPSARAKKLAKVAGKASRFVELVLQETRRVLKSTRDVFLVEDRRGLVCINAGIDKSNVEGGDDYALLPEDPDCSAECCRSALEALTGKRLGVVVCDTYSRPFRRGQVNFAIGVSGVGLFRDYRGKKDLFGRILKVKNVAVVDELAAAAELLMGQGTEARPVVVLRGLQDSVVECEDCRLGDLLIHGDEDLFRGAL
jgi:coenzyme F420-0:L-glutamate ligase/coenzyme F420-1:gamma-L-glutamate ligase